MPPKRKADESLDAGPSKKRNVAVGAAAARQAAQEAKRLGAFYKTTVNAMAPGLIKIATQTAKEVEESETLLVENGQIAQLEEDLIRRIMEGEEAKQRLVMEQLLRLQEEELQMLYRQDEARQDRIRDELLIHIKFDVMQLVRTRSRAPNETDKEVRLSKMPNDRETLRPTGDRMNPLYTAGLGRGRFYIEAAAMWDDWWSRRNEVAAEDRRNVLPRSYKEVKAAKLAEEEELARVIQAHRIAEAAERAVERDRQLELAEIRRRLPMIPAYPPGQHPGYKRSRGITKWSKRAVKTESLPPLPKRTRLRLTMPKKPLLTLTMPKPVGITKGKGKKAK